MYRGGFDSRRMLLQQSLGTPEGGLSPFVALMQQNTRLIILTLEVGRMPKRKSLSHEACAGPWSYACRWAVSQCGQAPRTRLCCKRIARF